MQVVLVHGFLNRGGIMGSLARALTAEGHTCFTPTLTPCDARIGLPALAEQLRAFVDSTVPDDRPFALVGLSMGAVIARYYLQELDGATRVNAFFSIAGPHAGTWLARFYPTRGIRELRPRSEFLRRLQKTVTRISHLSVTCYWTPYDIMIRPISSTLIDGAVHVRIPAPLHSMLVFDRRLHRDIAQRLATISGVSSATEPYRA
jgi:triacylglycerol lipase